LGVGMVMVIVRFLCNCYKHCFTSRELRFQSCLAGPAALKTGLA
jgi:hypothetical protein